jgi:myo-inositol catabolism protein IolC
MIAGYDKPLYILPFDHRHSYIEGIFHWHWKAALAPAQVAEIVASKQVIYDGFKAAAADATLRGRAGILVDEQFGAEILRDASAQGFITCVSTEKSGQDEYDFEYGEEFAHHIEAVNPTFAKVLVRYNPQGDPALNARQVARLRRLSDYLARTKRLFMFELLVPAEPAQLARLGGNQATYDRELRPTLMNETILALQDAGVEPDVGKIEGLDRREDCERMVSTARRAGRAKVGCIVLGRGSDEQAVIRWLSIAASVPGFIGFAVGRTTWLDAVTRWRAHAITRESAVARIAARFREWAATFNPPTASGARV